MGGRAVVGGQARRIGSGSPTGWLPTLAAGETRRPLAIWITHHDINIPGYDEGWIKPHEIEGIDLLINGHIHRRLEGVQAGRTLWVTPGNISRRARSDASREHVPAVLRVDVGPNGFQLLHVEVPHRPLRRSFLRGGRYGDMARPALPLSWPALRSYRPGERPAAPG